MDNLLLQAIARGWCSPENSHKEMDSRLATAIEQEVRKAFPEIDNPERGKEAKDGGQS